MLRTVAAQPLWHVVDIVVRRLIGMDPICVIGFSPVALYACLTSSQRRQAK